MKVETGMLEREHCENLYAKIMWMFDVNWNTDDSCVRGSDNAARWQQNVSVNKSLIKTICGLRMPLKDYSSSSYIELGLYFHYLIKISPPGESLVSVLFYVFLISGKHCEHECNETHLQHVC